MMSQNGNGEIPPNAGGVINDQNHQDNEEDEVPPPPGTIENKYSKIELLEAKIDHLWDLMLEKDQSLEKLEEDSNTYKAMLASMEEASKLVANKRSATPPFPQRIPVIERTNFPSNPESRHS